MEHMAEEKKASRDFLVPLLVVGIIGGAFFVGRLSAQVEYLTKGVSGSAAAAPAAAGAPQQVAAGATNLSADALKGYAKDLGLDTDKFNSCLDDGKYAQKVKDDTAYGTSLGVSGTPTFFINGIMLVGAQPQTEFEKIIDAELKDGSGDKVGATPTTRVDVKTNVGPIKGGENAKIKVVEFSDFECPYCKQATPTVNSVLEKYGDDISLEYRHYPLSFHPNADRAAQSTECALEQGKFWQMHDKLFGL